MTGKVGGIDAGASCCPFDDGCDRVRMDIRGSPEIVLRDAKNWYVPK
ncbi:MAG: hypothetical protein ACLP00_31310 [Terracidiphilus sp.]